MRKIFLGADEHTVVYREAIYKTARAFFGLATAMQSAKGRHLSTESGPAVLRLVCTISHQKGAMTLGPNKTAAFGIFPREALLENVLQSLHHAGFLRENICIFLTPTHPIAARLQHMSVGAA